MTLCPLHAKTLSGLEQVLAAELTELGASDVQPGHRLVTFVGDQRLMYRANLSCRTAIRILKPIANFPADSERALYDGVQQIDWSRFLDPDRSLALDPVVWSSFCTHSLFVAQLSKDAIVETIRQSLRLHRFVHGLCGGRRRGDHDDGRPLQHLSQLGPAKHAAERFHRRGASVLLHQFPPLPV
jgi:23S rRNA G2445 N2-methylase RlmL